MANVGAGNRGVANAGRANTGVANVGQCNLGVANLGEGNVGIANLGRGNTGVANLGGARGDRGRLQGSTSSGRAECRSATVRRQGGDEPSSDHPAMSRTRSLPVTGTDPMPWVLAGGTLAALGAAARVLTRRAARCS
ncbi:MAG: pentapeptide repeat-containing protein [Sporichthyaceae bacterium]